VKTTREHFGTTLATAARLYAAAEKIGDVARARAYAVAVDALLDAWPPDDESLRPSSAAERPSGWPVHEQTLVGLGIVPELLEAASGA
jgi:hypothetical protein